MTTAKRSSLLPHAPTISEAGLTGYEAGNWFCVFAPAGTPAPVVERLNGAINAAMSSPQMKDRLQSQGAEPAVGHATATGRPGEERTRLIRKDREGGEHPRGIARPRGPRKATRVCAGNR